MSPLDPSALLLLARQDVTITYGETAASSAVTALTVLKIIGFSLLMLGLILQLAGAARRGIGGLLRLRSGRRQRRLSHHRAKLTHQATRWRL